MHLAQEEFQAMATITPRGRSAIDFRMFDDITIQQLELRPQEDDDGTVSFDFALNDPDRPFDLDAFGDFMLSGNGRDASGTITSLTAGAGPGVRFAVTGVAVDLDDVPERGGIEAVIGTLFLGGADIVRGGAQADFLRTFGGNDRGTLGGEKDTAFLGAGDDRMSGGADHDRLHGEAGNDQLFGDAGLDILIGGAGNDVLNGGTGNDTLAGGPGRDRFVFDTGFGNDRVRDFRSGDRLDFRGVDDVGGIADLTIRQRGDDTVVTADGGGSVRLLNTDAEDLGPGSFLFATRAAMDGSDFGV